MKRVLLFSLSLNVLGLLAFAWGVRRLGGWRALMSRARNDIPGYYANRLDLFSRLPERPGAVVLVGDSQIQQGEWHEWLGDSVLNRGIAGDGVDGVLRRLEPDVLRHRPSRIVVCVGVNDLLYRKTPEQVAGRYGELVAKLRQDAPQARLVLVSVLPVNNAIRRSGVDNAPIRALNEKIRALAERNGAAYLDLYALLSDPEGNLQERFTADGIHLNGAGYAVWVQAISNSPG